MNEMIELEEMDIIIKVPTESVSLTINAKVFTEKGLEYARMLHEGATALEDLYD